MYSKYLKTNTQFLGHKLIHQIHALSASGTDLNVKLRLAITIGKVLSHLRELTPLGRHGRDLGPVHRSRSSAANVLESRSRKRGSGVNNKLLIVPYRLLVMPLTVDLAKLGNKHQRSATFRNMQDKGTKKRSPKMNASALHDLRSTKVT